MYIAYNQLSEEFQQKSFELKNKLNKNLLRYLYENMDEIQSLLLPLFTIISFNASYEIDDLPQEFN